MAKRKSGSDSFKCVMSRLPKRANDAVVLFTCIGRRVSLLESFRDAAKAMKVKACFLGADKDELSPALQLCDAGILVKPTTHPSYIRQLLSVVKSYGVTLLVPTVDLDLKLLAQNKAKFAALGCRVLVSSPEVVDICQDKRKTYLFLRDNGFDTPETKSVRSALSARKMQWPCFVKPWDGYGSRLNTVVKNRKELEFYAKRIPRAICQEYVDADEYTCDAYVDLNMKVRCVVPRRRIEIRSGEVSKGRIVKNSHIVSEAVRLVETLGAGPGVITLQLFLNGDGSVKFIEINPRFGGGVPLSIKAGANFPKWILQEILGKKTSIRRDAFKDNLTMLRYDAEVWL